MTGSLMLWGRLPLGNGIIQQRRYSASSKSEMLTREEREFQIDGSAVREIGK